jgi:hypothetical protein
MGNNSIILILFLLGIIGITSALDESDDWAHNKDINIQDNSGKDLTNYQVLIKLDSSNFDFSQAKADGSDMRFTSYGMELPYWIEDWDKENKEAKIWVKVPNVPANGNAKLNLYYGNPNASATSNGDTTFEFFDDFLGNNLGAKWSRIKGDWQVNNGFLTHIGTGVVNVPTPDIIFSNYRSRDGISIHSKIRWINNGYFEDGIIWNFNPRNVNYYHALLSNYDYSNGARIEEFRNNSGGNYGHKYVPFKNIEKNKWYDYTVSIHDDYFEFYVDGSQIISWKPSDILDYGYVGLGCWKGQYNQEVEYDNIFVTKYAPSDPNITILPEVDENCTGSVYEVEPIVLSGLNPKQNPDASAQIQIGFGIVGNSNEPLVDALLFGCDGSGNCFLGSTDNNGNLVINGSPGNWQFTANAPGYFNKSMKRLLTSSTFIVLILQKISNVQSNESINETINTTINASENVSAVSVLSGYRPTYTPNNQYLPPEPVQLGKFETTQPGSQAIETTFFPISQTPDKEYVKPVIAHFDLSIDSDPRGAWIWLDGVNKSIKTPNKLVIQNPGSHMIEVKKIGYISCRKSCEIEYGMEPLYFELTQS